MVEGSLLTSVYRLTMAAQNMLHYINHVEIYVHYIINNSNLLGYQEKELVCVYQYCDQVLTYW